MRMEIEVVQRRFVLWPRQWQITAKIRPKSQAEI